MDIQEYFNKMKNIEEKLLYFLDHEEDDEENFENFIQIINNEKIRTNPYDFKIILYLINKISSNHHRMHQFYEKIEKILKTIKDEIKQFLSNDEIFKIFESNKRLLLFLIEEHIFTIDNCIFDEIMDDKYQKKRYPEYFSFEIKLFIEERIKNETTKSFSHPKQKNESDIFEKIQKNLNEDFEKFNEKRKKGQNDGYLYEIIQNDLIEEFITYVNKEFYPLNSYVEASIFETNEFLLKQNQTKLIEYAAFYGSTQIFKYLYKNNTEMTSNLWLYAIHGCDEEIFHILEEIKDENQNINNIKWKQCIQESIKCHHNYITNYILDNYIKNNECNDNDILYFCFKYYNFIYLDIDKINDENLFFYACKFDFFRTVEYFLNTIQIDLDDFNDNDDDI